jgi:signal transduction histidine kinase
MKRERTRAKELQMLPKNGIRTAVAYDAARLRTRQERINGPMPSARETRAEVQGKEESAIEQLVRANRDLARSNQDLERFASVVAHDLRSPLATINTLSMWILKDYADKLGVDGREYLTFLQNSVERMSALVDAVLQNSTMQYQSDDVLGPVDCGQVMLWVLRNLQAEIQAARASIKLDPLPVVLANEHRLQQVFQNLMSNAIRYRRPDFLLHVRVSAAQKDGEWTFCVQDNGRGIEAEYRERIFELFQPGAGMGLSICRRAVEQHGGRIWVASKPGQGSRFYFTIPSSEKKSPPRKAASKARPAWRAGTSAN